VVGEGKVFVATGDGRLWAFPTDCHGDKCKPAWTANVRMALFEPTVANGVVYVGALNGYYLQGALFAFPTKCPGFCRPVLFQTVDGAIESAPIVADGVVYVGTLTGNLIAFGLP
jgi:outer membrane protein assembly factor BamB